MATLMRNWINTRKYRRATLKALKASAKPIFPEQYEDQAVREAFRAYCKLVLNQVRR